MTVEEGSLRVHLSALRKTLGDGQFGNKYIAGIQGHGYSFIAPVTRLPADRDSGSAAAGMSNLPPALGRMVGRSNVVREIQDLLRMEQRLITIPGAGGIGKTTVALSGRTWCAGSGSSLVRPSSSMFQLVDDKEHLIGAVASAVGPVRSWSDPNREALLDFTAPSQDAYYS